MQQELKTHTEKLTSEVQKKAETTFKGFSEFYTSNAKKIEDASEELKKSVQQLIKKVGECLQKLPSSIFPDSKVGDCFKEIKEK